MSGGAAIPAHRRPRIRNPVTETRNAADFNRFCASLTRVTAASQLEQRLKTARHSGVVRVTHWLTFVAFIALLITGGEIVISHPRFYWGEVGNVNTKPLFVIPIPSSRDTVPTGYNYVMPDQNGWSRYLHFEAAWLAGADRAGVRQSTALSLGTSGSNMIPERRDWTWRAYRERIARYLHRSAARPSRRGSYNVLQRSAYLLRDLHFLSAHHLDGSGDVAFVHGGVSLDSRVARRTAIGADDSLLCVMVAACLSRRPHDDGGNVRILAAHARHDHRVHAMNREDEPMSPMTRRKLIYGGAATQPRALAGLAVADEAGKAIRLDSAGWRWSIRARRNADLRMPAAA